MILYSDHLRNEDQLILEKLIETIQTNKLELIENAYEMKSVLDFNQENISKN